MALRDPLKIRLIAPMLVPTVALAGGILAADAGFGWIESLIAITLGAAVALSLSMVSGNPVLSFKIRAWHWTWVFLIFFGIGILSADFSRPAPLPEAASKEYPYLLAHIHDIETRTSGDLAVVSVEALIDHHGAMHSIASRDAILRIPDLPAGIDDRVLVPNILHRITDSPSSFNSGYAKNMERKGILYSLWLTEDAKIMKFDHESTLMGSARILRGDLEAFIEKTSLSRSLRSFVIAMLLGDRSYLADDTRDEFADAGISHVLALSGMHIGIITGIFMWLLFPFNLFGLYKWRIILTVPAVWGYTIVTGLMPSTVRAALMITAIAVCFLLQRKNSSWNALLLAAFIILLFSPFAVYDIGLQLSFVCVASLIFFASPMNPVDHRIHPLLYKTIALILASLVATIGSCMISAYYFERFPLLFLPANLIVLPVLPAFVVAVLIYLAFNILGLDLQFLSNTLNYIYSIFTGFLEWITGDGASSIMLHVSGVTVALWMLALILLVLWRHHARRWWMLTAASISAVAALLLIPYAAADASRPQLILNGGLGTLSASVKANGDVSRINFPVNAVTAFDFQSHRIIVADRNIDQSTSDSVLLCRYLMITRSCTDSLSSILESVHPDTLVIHSSIRKKREAELIKEAKDIGLPVYSLRRSKGLLIM